MTKYNRLKVKPAAASYIVTDKRATATTHEGAPGYARTEKSELFLLAVTNMVGEKTFYETADTRDARYEALCRQVVLADPVWFCRFVGWLRTQGNMRTASLVAAAQATKALLDAGSPGGRILINAVLQRADEPGEMLAYWISTFGRKVPKPVKRGIADAAERLYTERNYLKWDSESAGYRFADVIELCHPDAKALWQGQLYTYILDKRHQGVGTLHSNDLLPMLRANAMLRGTLAKPQDWLDPAKLADAGMTWEDVLSAIGSKLPKKDVWEAIIPSMGYMALLRNLRNFDQAGVSDAVARKVIEKLTDAEEIVKSKQFPFRFLAAYKAAQNLRWAWALELALNGSLGNVPELPGRTLVLVDRSGSMFDRISEKSGLNRADTAALFGSSLALRNPGRVTLVQYGSTSQEINVMPGTSLLPLVNGAFRNLGGTNTWQTVNAHYNGHDRIVILTDEQAHPGILDRRIANVPMYTWNLAGYRYGHAPSGSSNRHTFGGLTDAAFQQIQLLEAGRDAKWPWE